MKKNILSIVLFTLSLISINAQVKIGDNPSSINSNSVLEIESADKGLLISRVSLSATTNASPMSAHVTGMIVYNVTTAGDVSPGFYYNDGSKWIRIADNADITPNDGDGWGVTGENQTANIGRTGRVGVGTLSPATSLHVASSNGLRLSLASLSASSTYTLSTTTNKLRFNYLPEGIFMELSNVGGTSGGNPTAALRFADAHQANNPNYSFYNDSNTGMRNDLNNRDHIKFVTAGADRMTIDNLGNVGIGTTSPDVEFQVDGSIEFGNTTNVLTSNFNMVGGTGNTVSGKNSFAMGASNNVTGDNSTALGQSGTISDYGGLTIGNACSIDGSRSFAGGQASSIGTGAYMSFAFGNNAAIGANHFQSIALGLNATTTAANQFVTRYSGGYRLYSNNTAGVMLATSGSAWTSISDRRSKNSIENIGYGLSTIMKLRPTEYKYNGNNNLSLGFIAQEVQEIVPEAVTETGMGPDNDYLGITYTELIPILTKAIQELNIKLENSLDENNDLKSEKINLQNELKSQNIRLKAIEEALQINNLKASLEYDK